MIHQVGETAGKVWHLLNQEGEQTFSKIKSHLKAKDAMVYMALGWLAREDQIDMKEDGRVVKYSLKSA